MSDTNVADHRTLFTSHGMVLIHVAQHPMDTIRTISRAVGLTERRTMEVLADLKTEGYITVQREGRNNTYTVTSDELKLHPQLDATFSLTSLIELITGGSPVSIAAPVG